jgi:serine/threonine-protein kinase
VTTPRFEGYRVLSELGSGALSTVHKATQEPLGRVVAIKQLKATINPGSPFAAQLEREAHVLASLSHPNVAMLFDFVKSDDAMYLVLEYVDGWSLATVASKAHRLAPEIVAALGADIAAGLAHAHARGVVHRDIKPANIMISKRGDVKISDFGIAQRERLPSADEPLSRIDEAAAFGTPAYMSPEQILGEIVDARSDIFSLGVVLYQLLAGARPFERGDEKAKRAAAQRIRRDPPIPLHRRAPDVPRALERIVMRMIEKLPADRYASAQSVADHLNELVASRTRAPHDALVRRALSRADLIQGDDDEVASVIHDLDARRASIRPSIMGLLVALGLIVVGGGVIQYTGREGAHRVLAGERPLELVPAEAGGLRVLATPWADVWVDGQMVDTTPFARAIPLAAGKHYVVLVHPNAPSERREVTIAAGETTTIDVSMSIDSAGPSESGSALAPPKAPSAPSSTLSTAPLSSGGKAQR